MKKILLLCLATFFIFGCKSSFNTAAILNFNEQQIPENMTIAQIEKCIITGGATRGWKIAKIKPGLMEGSIYTRGHTAIVTIPYTKAKYSIIYKDSSKDLYADEEGRIHKRYNTWVMNLNNDIHARMLEERYQ
jgi:hypothetical protein